jgi:hypothetical protein
VEAALAALDVATLDVATPHVTHAAQLGTARARGLAPPDPQRRHGHEHFDPVK